MAALTEIQLGQENFLMRGGTYELPLQRLRKDGILPTGYEYREYPKMIRLSNGHRPYRRPVKTCEGTIVWDEGEEEIFQDITVNSEDEEERVLAGGKTSAQMEEERQGLLQRCRAMGIPADAKWSAVRLRRELGDALDAPPPGDEMAKLESELANLKKMAAMQAEIEALKAQLARPADNADTLRAELEDLGITADRRWGLARLREELDRATAPGQGV